MPLPYVDPYPTTAEDRLAVILACWPCCRDEGKAATDRAIRELVAVAAQLLVSDAKTCFATGSDPEGGSWPPLKRPRRLRGGLVQLDAKPLRDTNVLMGSITGSVQGNTVSVGTKVNYGGFQNFGTRYIPPRRFLGVSAKTRQRIEGLVVQAVLGQIRGQT